MSERKKVIFAINNLGVGGAENMLVEQLSAFDRTRFELGLITILPLQKVNLADMVPEDVKFTKFNFSGIYDVLSLYKLWNFLREEKADTVVTSLFDANLLVRIAAVIARVPVILSSELNVSENKKRWQITADRILAKFTKKILVSSNEVLEFTSKQENLPQEKFQLNFNAIPLRLGNIKINRNEVLSKLEFTIKPIYIVTAGRLIEQKGHRYLIDAVAKMKQEGLNNFKVLIFGKGVLQDELVQHIEKLNLGEEVKFMGLGSMEEILAISDIFVFPSLWEGLSIALLQAMDAGCPIVATKISGTNEVLEDGVNGLLVEPGKSDELSKALSRLLKDEELRAKIAMGAKERVKKFSIEENVKVIENLILPS